MPLPKPLADRRTGPGGGGGGGSTGTTFLGPRVQARRDHLLVQLGKLGGAHLAAAFDDVLFR